jgi:hypothetical protein
LIGFLKKPWWVGPLIAGVSYNHYHSEKPPEPAAVSGYEVVHNRGNLPRNGRVVVVATCPAGKRAISGGYSTPTRADTTEFSNPRVTTPGRSASKAMAVAALLRFMPFA